jgi:hypothetical protein
VQSLRESPKNCRHQASGIGLGRIPIRPDVSAAPAARLADEARLDIGQAEVVGPLIAADRDRMAAFVVGAEDQDPEDAAGRISTKVIFWGRGNMGLGMRTKRGKESDSAGLNWTLAIPDGRKSLK